MNALGLLLSGKAGELSFEQRREVLMLLTEFFRNHVENFGTMRSVEVLRDILH